MKKIQQLLWQHKIISLLVVVVLAVLLVTISFSLIAQSRKTTVLASTIHITDTPTVTPSMTPTNTPTPTVALRITPTRQVTTATPTSKQSSSTTSTTQANTQSNTNQSQNTVTSTPTPTIAPTTPSAPSPTTVPEQTVSMQVTDPDGTKNFTVTLHAGDTLCDNLTEAKNEGKIKSLTLDSSYMDSYNSLYVREMDGFDNNWTVSVVGSTSPEGCSLYNPKANDTIVWKFL